MKFSIRKILMMSLPVVGLALAAPQARAEPITIGQGITIGWSPFFVAEARDLWKKNGLDAKVVSFPAGRLVIESILGGSAAFGTATETPVALTALSGLPIRIIAVIDTHEVYDLVATTDIKTVKDIKGKRIGFPGGTNAQVYTARLLEAAGLTSKDIISVNISPAELPGALAGGSIDGFVWSEPQQSQAIALKPGAFHRLSVPGLYKQYSAVVTTQNAIDTRRAELVAGLRALIEADAFIKASPGEAADLVAARIKLDPKLAREIWPRIDFGVTLKREELVAELRKQAQWAIDAGVARPGSTLPDFNTVVVDSLLAEAYKSSAQR